MTTISVPTRDSVSPANQAIFDQLHQGLGFVPNLYATFAYSETALATYLALQNAKSSLSAKEREVVNLATSQANGCEYCLAAHTALGQMVGFSAVQVIEIRKAEVTFDGKLDSLAKLVKNIVVSRGHPDQNVLQAFFDAGFTKGNLVDVMVVIGDKTTSNYLHGTTLVPVDFPPAPAI